MKTEYIKRYKAAKTEAQKKKLKNEFDKHVKTAINTFANCGAKNIKFGDLERMARTLTASKTNFNAINKIYNSAEKAKVSASIRSIKNVGEVVPTVAQGTLPVDTLATLGDLCDNPLTASIERSYSCEFAFKVRIWCWCPTWYNPGRWCYRTLTLAGVSFAIGIDIGYRIDCRGFVAWGVAYAEACGTLIGIKFCASCEGRVEAGAALGQTTGAGDCRYGAGASLGISCQFCGITVFQIQYGIGLLITAPCII